MYAARKKYRQRKVSHPEDIAKGGRLCTEKLAKFLDRSRPVSPRFKAGVLVFCNGFGRSVYDNQA